MARTKTVGEYTRVTRPQRHLAGVSSLWFGPDHVLGVDSTGYAENYSRYYYRDIQALLVRHSDRRLYLRLLWGGLWVFILSLAGLNDAQWGYYIFWSLLLVPPLIINEVRGPTVVVHLMTKVQTCSVRALARRSAVEVFIDALKPRVEAAQADLVPAAVQDPAPVPGMAGEGPLP